MINDIFIGFKQRCNSLERNYEDYTIDELANKYCEAVDDNDSYNKDIYISALILRFWFQINKIYEKVKQLGYEKEDTVSILFECITAACEYRAWQDPAKHTNAQACINQAIASRGAARLLYFADKDTRRVNVNTASLDQTLSVNDEKKTLADIIEDTNSDIEQDVKTRQIVYDLIRNNKIVEAIIVDNILYQNVIKYDKKVVDEVLDTGEVVSVKKNTAEFWEFKLVQELCALDSEYADYFKKAYEVKDEKLSSALDSIKKANNQRKYKLIASTLKSLRHDFA